MSCLQHHYFANAHELPVHWSKGLIWQSILYKGIHIRISYMDAFVKTMYSATIPNVTTFLVYIIFEKLKSPLMWSFVYVMSSFTDVQTVHLSPQAIYSDTPPSAGHQQFSATCCWSACPNLLLRIIPAKLD